MDEIKKLFGRRLKYLREINALTQEKLAEKMDISCRALSAIECGKNFVTAETINKICTALEISPKTLFDFDFKYKNEKEIKEELIKLIDKNEAHLLNIYKIIKGYLQ